ncbi:MAG: trypsin-like serine protease [Bacteroidetes bacterium]|nr:MAG: trypsin-like serine protease [Bacteroidota bacterium]
MRNVVSFFLVALLLFQSTGCALLFVPNQQKISITTEHEDAKVYANQLKVASGKKTKAKLYKGKPQEIVVQTPGYLDESHVIVPDRFSYLFLGLGVFDLFFTFGLISVPVGLLSWKAYNYDSKKHFRTHYEKEARGEKQKFMQLAGVDFKIVKNNIPSTFVPCEHHKDGVRRAMKNGDDQLEKEIQRKSKRGIEAIEYFAPKSNYQSIDPDKIARKIGRYLKDNQFVDTSSMFLQDRYNTVYSRAKIDHIKTYGFNAKNGSYKKVKLDGFWYFHNQYDEIVDSFPLREYSGERSTSSDGVDNKLVSDALLYSLNEIIGDDLKEHLEIKEVDNFSGNPLKIQKPARLVSSINESGIACVTVKRKDGGHGSGFAISNDGYILTNFHVIAGKTIDKQAEVSVLLGDDKELKAEIVRFNRAYDVALLKVKHNFEKAFLLNKEKTYDGLTEIFTNGAPESIELGQTITQGMIIKEREQFGRTKIQLSMPVNSGNSGGPVFDEKGVLHGMIKSKLLGYTIEGIGFGIPAFEIYKSLNIQY